MFLLALLWLAAEIIAFVAVAHAIGFLLALLILIVVSALGPAIVRRVGFGVVRHAQEHMAQGQPPTGDVLDGVLVLGGGLLICIPGFIGDAFGLLLMARPVRRLVTAFAGHRIYKRVGRIRRRGAVIDTTASAPPWPGPDESRRRLNP